MKKKFKKPSHPQRKYDTENYMRAGRAKKRRIEREIEDLLDREVKEINGKA